MNNAKGRASLYLTALVLLLLAGGSRAADPAIDLGPVTEKHAMVPMRDGVSLSAFLYFPKGDGPWPVLYEQRYASLTGAETRKFYARLSAAGYVVCAENFRGAQQ